MAQKTFEFAGVQVTPEQHEALSRYYYFCVLGKWDGVAAQDIMMNCMGIDSSLIHQIDYHEVRKGLRLVGRLSTIEYYED